MDYIPEEIDDIRYCVLDYSDPDDPDYIFPPLVFMEIFNAPATVLQIGNHTFKMPIDWSIIICDSEVGDPEVIPITSLNDRGFKAFCLNPISSYMPSFHDVEIVNVYSEVKWHFPKIKPGQFLAVPLGDEQGSLCAFFVKETNKVPDILDISKLW